MEQIMLNPLPKGDIGETLDAHTAKRLDIDAAADELFNKLLTLSSFMT